ncbi:MAG TPA: hypothetical protein VKR23_03295 [Gaiellaceae bacterium]|nr:hypothetical protein [Gaiellaceae bacterium]
MARLSRKLRPGPVTVAITAYNLWKRLSPRQRRQIMAMARRHGPTVVAKAADLGRRARKR